MEGLRTFIKVVICIVLVPLILGFTIIIQTKDIVENQFVVEAIKQLFENQMEESDFDAKVFDELTSTQGANELVENLIAEYSKYTEDNTYQVSDETAEMIINYCIENEATLEELSEEEMDFEELKKPEAKEEIRKAVDEAFRDINSDGEETFDMIIYGYAQVTSQENVMRLATIIVVLIALIILLSWSAYKWMTPIGVVSLITGVITLGLYGVLSALANAIKRDLGLLIDVKLLLIIGAAELFFGLGFVITRSILDSNARKAKLEKNIEPEVITESEEKVELNNEPEENDEK